MTKRADCFKLLIIGPLPPPIGGATVVFQNLTDYLQNDPRVELDIIDLSRHTSVSNPWENLKTLLHVLVQTWRRGRHADVISYHSNYRGRIYVGPVIYLMTRLLGKPLIVRTFGGAFDQQYRSLPKPHRWIMLKTYFASEINLFQTKSMTQFFAQIPIRRAEWFSNCTRDLTPTLSQTPYKTVCRQFIFLGRVTPTKGIDIMLEAAPQLPDDAHIDIYGPLDANYASRDFDKESNGKVRYRGVLSRDEVESVLWKYDALVLPTFHTGEGYPGVVMEAYAHGLPVIITRWMSIPEIVDEQSGILIEPVNLSEFVQAVRTLNADTDFFARLQRGAREKAAQFSETHWFNTFVEFCSEVI